MRFGRVDGFLRVEENGELSLLVNLETGREITEVRHERVAKLRPIAGQADLLWHVDQYTQETIAVDLAEQGWEVFAEGETPAQDDAGVIRSAGYLVRQL